MRRLGSAPPLRGRGPADRRGRANCWSNRRGPRPPAASAAFQVREPDLDGRALAGPRRLASPPPARAPPRQRPRGRGGRRRRWCPPARVVDAGRSRARVAPARARGSPGRCTSLGELRAAGAGGRGGGGRGAARRRSKPAAHPALGLDGLAALVAASAVPVVAIGGLAGRDWPALPAMWRRRPGRHRCVPAARRRVGGRRRGAAVAERPLACARDGAGLDGRVARR